MVKMGLRCFGGESINFHNVLGNVGSRGAGPFLMEDRTHRGVFFFSFKGYMVDSNLTLF